MLQQHRVCRYMSLCLRYSTCECVGKPRSSLCYINFQCAVMLLLHHYVSRYIIATAPTSVGTPSRWPVHRTYRTGLNSAAFPFFSNTPFAQQEPDTARAQYRLCSSSVAQASCSYPRFSYHENIHFVLNTSELGVIRAACLDNLETMFLVQLGADHGRSRICLEPMRISYFETGYQEHCAYAAALVLRCSGQIVQLWSQPTC